MHDVKLPKNQLLKKLNFKKERKEDKKKKIRNKKQERFLTSSIRDKNVLTQISKIQKENGLPSWTFIPS